MWACRWSTRPWPSSALERFSGVKAELRLDRAVIQMTATCATQQTATIIQQRTASANTLQPCRWAARLRGVRVALGSLSSPTTRMPARRRPVHR